MGKWRWRFDCTIPGVRCSNIGSDKNIQMCVLVCNALLDALRESVLRLLQYRRLKRPP